MKVNNTNKGSILTLVAFFLLSMVMLTTHFTSGLYAKYVSRGASESTARVAGFGTVTIVETGDFVDLNGNSVNPVLIPGVDLVKRSVVEFTGSELATYVFVQIEPSSQWTYSDKMYSYKNLISWTVDDEWIWVEDNVFYLELGPVTDWNENIIKNDLISVSHKLTETELAALNNLSISFQAFVVQSSGFDNAESAWASINR